MNALKLKRLDLRLSGEIKSMIERAARMKNLSLSSYMLEAATARAREDISALERLRLQDRDWEIFYTALKNPPEPNRALKQLMGSVGV